MKNIYILVHEDVVLSSAAAPLDIFTRTNDILGQMGRVAAFDISLVTRHASEVRLGIPASFTCQRSLEEIPPKSDGHHQDLILVPAFAGEWNEVRGKNSAAIAWLKQHYEAGTEVASLCKGSYFFWRKQHCSKVNPAHRTGPLLTICASASQRWICNRIPCSPIKTAPIPAAAHFRR